jgi:hypothetical protein
MARSGIAPGAAAALVVAVLVVGIVAGYESGPPRNSASTSVSTTNTATVTSTAPGSATTTIVTTTSPPSTITMTTTTIYVTITKTVTQTVTVNPIPPGPVVAVTETAFRASDFGTGVGGTVTCVSPNTSPAGSYLSLTNSGGGYANVYSITITWAGSNNTFLVTSSGCVLTPASSSGANILAAITGTPKLSVPPVRGQPYSGTVDLANGGMLIPFSGTWQ